MLRRDPLRKIQAKAVRLWPVRPGVEFIPPCLGFRLMPGTWSSYTFAAHLGVLN
jgi:hypothetical protein